MVCWLFLSIVIVGCCMVKSKNVLGLMEVIILGCSREVRWLSVVVVVLVMLNRLVNLVRNSGWCSWGWECYVSLFILVICLCGVG